MGAFTNTFARFSGKSTAGSSKYKPDNEAAAKAEVVEKEQVQEQEQTKVRSDAKVKQQAPSSASESKPVRPSYFTPKPSRSSSPSSNQSSNVGIASMVLLLGGILKYIFFNEISTISYVLSLLFFVIAGYALAEKLETKKVALLIPMFAFVVWYFMFNGRIDPQFLIYFLGTLGLISLGFTLLSRGEGVKPEIYGLIPPLFLFLDQGLIPFMVEKLNLTLTPVFETLILSMPWWALLGLLTLPAEFSKSNFLNTVAGLLKVLGIMYLIVVLIFPIIPELGYEKLKVAGMEDLSAAQQRIQERASGGENPAISYVYCLFKGEYADPSGCVKGRQQDSLVASICKNQRKLDVGTPEFDNCLKTEKEKLNTPALQIEGTIDQLIKEPFSAKIAPKKESWPTVYGAETGLQLPFPIELQIKNPREKEVKLVASCSFEDTKKNNIPGKILPTSTLDNPIKFNSETYPGQFLCYLPASALQESATTPSAASSTETTAEVTAVQQKVEEFTLKFEVQLLGLTTSSRLQRAFVRSDLQQEEVDRLYKEEISKVVKVKEVQVPADPVGIYFDLGQGTGQPIIQDKPYLPIIVRAYAKNQGQGQMSHISEYNLNLDQENFVAAEGSTTCFSGEREISERERLLREFPLSTCLIASYPEELKNPSGLSSWTSKEFQATLNYDYILKSQDKVRLTKIENK
ncbi:hypothetical protein HYU21_01740 [Candidatus Woesearchaeota archaeon]|nr:hypothetical protein [Candidatus Woesearchaeota archaeon]